MLDGEADGGAEGGDGMGKLIDSDVVKEYLKRAIWGADPKIDGWVDAMPAADAVPMEWLRDRMLDMPSTDEALSKAAWRVMRAWEKEQEGKNG